MEYAEKALKALDEFEAARQQAVEELTAAKKDIETKLARLEERGAARPKKVARRNPCPVCGSADHTAAFHKRQQAKEREGL